MDAIWYSQTHFSFFSFLIQYYNRGENDFQVFRDDYN